MDHSLRALNKVRPSAACSAHCSPASHKSAPMLGCTLPILLMFDLWRLRWNRCEQMPLLCRGKHRCFLSSQIFLRTRHVGLPPRRQKKLFLQ